MSFRNNSLERQNQSNCMFEESINGSTRDLFFDCEEELYMSGDDSSDDEHTGKLFFLIAESVDCY